MGAFDHLSDDDPRIIEYERRQQRCSCENKAVRSVGALKRTGEIYRPGEVLLVEAGHRGYLFKGKEEADD